MKAININGTINTYNNTPKSWGSVICGFDSLSDEQLKTHGFYDVVVPSYNYLSEKLSDIAWDESNEVFTYTVNDKDFSASTIDQLKEMQIKDVKARGHLKLLKTDWYIIRKAEEDVSIPNSIITERDNLRTAMNTKESEINALTAKKAIIEYDKEL